MSEHHHQDLRELLAVDEALARVMAHFQRLPGEEVALERGRGRILGADVRAPFDLPSFANSAMDGYAVRSADVATAGADHPVHLQMAGEVQAGTVWPGRLEPGTALGIMTGAALPEGADAVVPVEETREVDGRVEIFRGAEAGAFVRMPGEDVRAGSVVLTAGTPLRAAQIGLLAALGLASVSVRRRPRVVVLATGDELLAPGQPPQPGKIFDANGPALTALLEEYGAEPLRLPIVRDTAQAVAGAFARALELRPDLILTSGGVSVGGYDLVRRHLEARGEVALWRIRMQPGKPLLFGRLEGVPLMGLPGNPVSSLLTAHVFVRAVVAHMLGTSPPLGMLRARLGQRWENRSGRRQYLRVRLERREDAWWAWTTGPQGSHIISSLVRARGLLIVPEDSPPLSVGHWVEIELLD